MKLRRWRLPTRDELDANEHAQAVITCPDCQRERTLGAKHHVAPSGYVVPSVVCVPPCNFHEWVTLVDWDDRYVACTECVWIGNRNQLDDDSQDWEVCPACGSNVYETKRLGLGQ